MRIGFPRGLAAGHRAEIQFGGFRPRRTQKVDSRNPEPCNLAGPFFFVFGHGAGLEEVCSMILGDWPQNTRAPLSFIAKR